MSQTYSIAGQPAVDVAFVLFLAVFMAGFALAIYAIFNVILRIGLPSPEDSIGKTWSERMGRRNSRFNRFLVDDEFQKLRKLATFSMLTCIAAMACMFALGLVFGQKI